MALTEKKHDQATIIAEQVKQDLIARKAANIEANLFVEKYPPRKYTDEEVTAVRRLINLLESVGNIGKKPKQK